jgi:ATP-dependent DNA ligase
VAAALRGRRPRRRRRKADRRRLPARQARDAEDQARAHRRLRRRRLPLAQARGTGIDAVGSLLLGLYDDAGVLHHVGITSSFTMEARRALVASSRRFARMRWLLTLAQLGRAGGGAHRAAGAMQRMPGAKSRWSTGKDLSWEPLRPERVCEVKYDHLQGDRFRHATTFVRWRLDKRPQDCRYDQLETIAPYELKRIFER